MHQLLDLICLVLLFIFRKSMERRFFVISCGARSKKVAYSDDMSYTMIKSMIKNKFELSNTEFHLQYFDKDVNEYIDLEDELIDDIQEYKILKIKVVLSDVIKGDEESALKAQDQASEKNSTADQEPLTTQASLREEIEPYSATQGQENSITPKRPILKPLHPVELNSRANQEEQVFGIVPQTMPALASPERQKIEYLIQSPPVNEANATKTTSTR